jgi:hypothetical protein
MSFMSQLNDPKMLAQFSAKQNNPMSAYGMPQEKIPKGYRKGTVNQYTPQQMQLHENNFQYVDPNSYLARLAQGDQGLYDEYEAPARRQFDEYMGNLANRFSNTGMGARRGSDFRNSANSATSNFVQDLASKRHELRSQAVRDLMDISNQLLGQRPQENFLIEKQQKPNPWAEIGGKFAGAIPGAVAGFMLGGPVGAAAGGASSFFGGGAGGGGYGGGTSQGLSPVRLGGNTSGRYGLPTFGGF